MSLGVAAGGRPVGVEGEGCFICSAPAPWSVWGGEWRPVCRRHFVIMRWDTLSDPERGLSEHLGLQMAHLKYAEELERRDAKERGYLADVSSGAM